MEQIQSRDITLDPESLQVESFTTQPQTAMVAAFPGGECTGCVSGCGIFGEP